MEPCATIDPSLYAMEGSANHRDWQPVNCYSAGLPATTGSLQSVSAAKENYSECAKITNQGVVIVPSRARPTRARTNHTSTYAETVRRPIPRVTFPCRHVTWTTRLAITLILEHPGVIVRDDQDDLVPPTSETDRRARHLPWQHSLSVTKLLARTAKPMMFELLSDDRGLVPVTS